MKYIILTFLLLITFQLDAQTTYWKYEKKNPVLVTAMDIELMMSLFSTNDYIEYDATSDKLLLYMYEANMEPENLNEKPDLTKRVIYEYKYKIFNDKLKLVIRVGVDDIYFLTFTKQNINKTDFQNIIIDLKD